jgi:hypothetical protein
LCLGVEIMDGEENNARITSQEVHC